MSKYKLIILDIDGTIVKHISSWQYIHEKLGLWNELAYCYQEQFRQGKISYKKFCELDATHWKGLREEKIKRIFKNVPYTQNAVNCLRKLKARGFKLVAISTGLQYLAERIKKELKFDYVLHNRLVSRKGVLTGKVKINVSHGAKGKVLKKILRKMNMKPKEVISVGDSPGDIPLVKLSGYSIAFNSSDKTFSRLVNYNCQTKDFKEVFRKIISISGAKSSNLEKPDL